jgi:hypothetical protein
MANHRTPDGVMPRYTVLDSAVRTTHTVIPSPRATSAWTYGPPAPAVPAPRTATPPPFPRIADIPSDLTAPAWPTASRPVPVGPATRSTPLVALSAARGWSAPATPSAPLPTQAPAAQAPTTQVTARAATPSGALEIDSALRSAPDDIAARATTTLIPSSPGARSRSGPVFVDGSGRRARRFKGVAAAAAALAAGYVGVVVTGALAGATGPAVGPVSIASGASLAPATPVLAPKPVLATPVEATAPKPARPAVTVKKKVTPTRVVPKKVAPRVVPPPPAPVVKAAPVAPAPAPVVVPPPAAPAAPVTPPAPVTTPKNGTGQTKPQTPAQQNGATPAAKTLDT